MKNTICSMISGILLLAWANVNAQENTGLSRGYYCTVEFGNGISASERFVNANFRLNITHSYRVNPYFSAGAGTGLRLFPSPMLPVYGNIRVNFLDRKVTPYVSTDAGYTFRLFDLPSGGVMVNPVVGVSMRVKTRLSLNFGIGYDFQNYTYTDYEMSDEGYNQNGYFLPSIEEVTVSRNCHGVNFLFGMTF